MKKLATFLLVVALLAAGAAFGWEYVPEDYRKWAKGTVSSFTSSGEWENKAAELPFIDVVPVEGESKLEMIDVTSLREHRYLGVSIRLPYDKPEKVLRHDGQVTLVFPRQTSVVIFDPDSDAGLYEQLKKGAPYDVEAGERFFDILHINDEQQLYEKMLSVTTDSFGKTQRNAKRQTLYALARLKAGFLTVMPGDGPPRRFDVDRRTAWVFGDPADAGNPEAGKLPGAAVEMHDPEGNRLKFYLKGSEVELQTLIATAERVK